MEVDIEKLIKEDREMERTERRTAEVEEDRQIEEKRDMGGQTDCQ